MATEYEEAKAALGIRDPVGDLVALNRRLQKRFEHEQALEVEVRALREALAFAQSAARCNEPWSETDYARVDRALSPDPEEGGAT